MAISTTTEEMLHVFNKSIYSEEERLTINLHDLEVAIKEILLDYNLSASRAERSIIDYGLEILIDVLFGCSCSLKITESINTDVDDEYTNKVFFLEEIKRNGDKK